MVRQGDVYVVKLQQVPAGDSVVRERDNGRVILAYGETTGHAHAIVDERVEMRLFGEMEVIVAEEPFTLRHEEHGAIALDPGIYEVRHQREYVAPAEVRRVLD